MTLVTIEIARVTPAVDSSSVLNSTESLAVPLIFFDLPWLSLHPVKRVLFYELTESSRDHFHSSILPTLKLSLSVVLRSYLPLTGHITWNQDEPKPSIVVSPNDAVLLTIAETNADFSLLSGYGQRPLSELHSLIPELPVSVDSATTFSLQITLFPNHGFSIGVAYHHAVTDGKSVTLFFKAWAHLCIQHLENREFSLPENLTPSFDRSLIKDLTGLDEQMIEIVRSLKDDKTDESRSLGPITVEKIRDDVVHATVVLSRNDVERLRERVISESPSGLHLSTFVIAYAYTWSCLVKSRGGENEERLVSLVLGADLRERLDPPLPATYFGNCLFTTGLHKAKAATFADERGFITAVEILSDLVKGLSSQKVENIAIGFRDAFANVSVSSQFGSVAGSTRFKIYETDFGWGRPVKADVVSILGEGISMAESRDESGGVEIGMCMKKDEMDIVLSLFNNGLQF